MYAVELGIGHLPQRIGRIVGPLRAQRRDDLHVLGRLLGAHRRDGAGAVQDEVRLERFDEGRVEIVGDERTRRGRLARRRRCGGRRRCGRALARRRASLRAFDRRGGFDGSDIVWSPLAVREKGCGRPRGGRGRPRARCREASRALGKLLSMGALRAGVRVRGSRSLTLRAPLTRRAPRATLSPPRETNAMAPGTFAPPKG